MTDLAQFDYHLPSELIAQTPKNPRESANLMVLDKKLQTISQQIVADLPNFMQKGDVIVINNTKVFHARLHATLTVSEKRIELFLVKPLEKTSWLCLAKPAKKLIPNSLCTIAPDFVGVVKEKQSNGTIIVDFALPPNEVIAKANTYGYVPVPPYIKTIPPDSDYQTVYAKKEGSVAAPTAGFHLTKQVLQQLNEKGVIVVEITLHVGLGTFLLIKTDTLESHTMHSEWAHISSETAQAITTAKEEHRRVIAIGTTTMRTLEGVAKIHHGAVVPFSGDIDLFIKPGFQLQVVDCLFTNFHLPKSTLLVLVSAFAGINLVKKAYAQAIENKYRFYSFGDAMLIL